VAVCGMLENETCLAIPEALSEVMGKTFLEFYDYYESTVRKKLHLHGQHMQVIGFFHRKPGDSHFGGLRCLSWQMVLVKVFAFKLQAFFLYQHTHTKRYVPCSSVSSYVRCGSTNEW
jgi:hypothetical protein